MYLKSLELQGFKSFPDKVRLEFNKGLTAVVGPNGSGKSNIGDAVRWVLGEQSSKTLRGAKMEDVIFAGTQFRKPVGFAMVTLHIHNGDRALNHPTDEVSVTRKLYRSGESEYLINGTQVRLKDIMELFMDTGLGRDGYSIIGQGRVAEIVSAKSGERRAIFEEAAGISKFRYQKEEAERRLSAAQDNLVRLQDILSELEGRVEPLRIQSEKANQFLDLSGKKKTLEISVWIRRLDELRVSLREREDELLANQAEYENIERDIARLEEQIQESYRSMQESSGKIDEMQNRILETERAGSQLHAEIAVYQNDISHAETNISSLLEQQDNARLSVADLEERIAEEQKKAEECESQQKETLDKLASAELALEKLASQAGSFDQSAEETAAELNRLTVRQSEYQFLITHAASANREIQEQIAQGESQKGLLSQNIEGLDRECQEMQEGLRVLQEKEEEHRNRIQGLVQLRESKERKWEDGRKRQEERLLKVKEHQQRLKLLEDLENSMEGFAHSVKEVVKAGKAGRIPGVLGSVAQLMKVEPEYTVAVETALGGALQNVVVQDEEAAKRGIRLLKERNAGRATFLPLTSVKGNELHENGLEQAPGFVALASRLVQCEEKLQTVMRFLLGRIVVAEDLDSASAMAKRYGYRFRIVTLDGQVVNAGGSFTGGSAARSAGVLSRRNEMDRLEAEIAAGSREAGEHKEILEKWKAEADKLLYDIEGEKEQLAHLGEDRIRFEAEARRIEAMKEQAAGQAENAESQIRRLRQRMEEQEAKFREAKENLASCAEMIAQTERRLAESQGRRDNYQQERDSLLSQISALKLRQMELGKDREALLKSVEQLRENSRNLEESTQRIQKQIAEQQEQIGQRQGMIQQRKEDLEKSSEQKKEFHSKISELQSVHRAAEQRATEFRGSLREKNEVKEKYSREDIRLQEKKTAVQKDYDAIIASLWEQYELTRTDAQDFVQEIPDLLQAQKELNELKNKIRALGTVNVAAIEEYQEVYQRYAFMKEQLDDVEISKKELERLIGELTDSMRRRFTESFQEINQNFKEIFVELFGGGKAELVLTAPEDVLSSGIEINVAPPGKVIKNLSLLSGGEQSFVAIAIYFAILRLKPAPFCILDEIEAALDDVNVSKYAQYLRNFTDATQFILVTHRRGTMEEADTLYGVTMQEKGISKLLKMEQTDVEQMSSVQ